MIGLTPRSHRRSIPSPDLTSLMSLEPTMRLIRSLPVAAPLLAFFIGSSMLSAAALSTGESNGQSQGSQNTAPPPPSQRDGAQPQRQPVSVLSVLSKHARGMGGSLIWEEMGPIELHLTRITGAGEQKREQESIVVMDGPERLRWTQPATGDTTMDTVRNGAFTWVEGGPKESRRYIRRSRAVAEARHKIASVNSWVAQLGLWFGQMEVGGLVDIEEQRCIRLFLRDRLDGLAPDAPADAQYTAYFSEETGRLVRITFPPVGRLYDPYSMHFSEWKTFGPVTVAARIEEHIGERKIVTIIRDVRLGEDVKASFDVPDAVTAQPDPDAIEPAPVVPGLGGSQTPPPATDKNGGSGRRDPTGTGGARESGRTGGTGDGPRQP